MALPNLPLLTLLAAPLFLFGVLLLSYLEYADIAHKNPKRHFTGVLTGLFAIIISTRLVINLALTETPSTLIIGGVLLVQIIVGLSIYLGIHYLFTNDGNSESA